nr:integrase, catalytic region, zinc finger, CCHC-type, peptidase aspartic, catalytic [Tanacetum cinerariifolium]
TTATAITEGTWGFEHTKACFRDDIIPFEKVLVITALKEQLDKLKGKAVLTKAVSLNPIDPELLKVDVTPVVPKLHSKATSSVLNFVSNVNSDLKCASSNECLFFDNHDTCVGAYKNSVNASKKSKSVKTPVIRKVWKTTGKVFKTVGHIWKPTKRTFTIVGNVCPLTRIATPTIVPPREPIPIVNSTKKPVVTLVYSKKPKSKKVSNIMEPNNSWGSSGSNVPSSLYACRLSKSSSGQFCDSDLEVAFRQHTCFIRNLDGVDLLTGSRGNNMYTLSIQDMMASSPICLMSKASKTKSWLWHHCLSHLNFSAINHLARQGLVRGPALNEMTPGTISSGLMHTTSPSTSYVPPSRNDWDLLFQPMFDELLNPPPSVVNQAPEAIAPIVKVIPPVNADLTGSPSSTTVEQDAPSTSNSTKPTEIQSSIIPQDVGDDNLDMEVAHMGSDPLFGIPILEVNSEQSTTPASPQAIVQTDHPPPHHNSKWTKDHPLNNIIGQLNRPVST